MPCSEYYFRLVFLTRIATKRLQQIFTDRYEQSKGLCWHSSQAKAFLDSEQGVKLTKDQKSTIKRKLPEEWDISLIAAILLNSSLLNDAQIKKHIQQLKKIRNAIAHNVTMSVSVDDFSKNWQDMEKILLAFGESSTKLEQLKNSGTMKKSNISKL